jgi:phage shock protein PspC (stress-responsive transcriptional regulator)
MTQMPFNPQRPGQQQPYRQLRRSATNRKLAGVCGGVADYFQVDPTFIRVAFLVVSVLTGGAFLLAYLLALVIMPDQRAAAPIWQTPPTPPAP